MSSPLAQLTPEQLAAHIQQQVSAQLSAAMQQQQQAAAPAVVVAASSSKPLVKPRAPSTFHASEKAPGELDQWEREMRYQFAAYGPALSTAASRITHAVSYLGPIPLQWWDANPAQHSVSTWEEFVALLRARFRPVNAAKLARIELFKLRQGLHQTAGAHAARFQELLVSLPKMDEDDKIHLFVHSLTPSLKRRVGDKEFTSLGAAINAAVQSEGLYGAQLATDITSSNAAAGDAMDLNHVADGSLYADYSGPTRAGPLSSKPVGEQLAILREQLNAMGSRSSSSSSSSRPPFRAKGRNHRGDLVTGLDPAVVKERLATHACVRCGSHSHWKSECPQKRA